MIDISLTKSEAQELYKSLSRQWHVGKVLELISKLGSLLQGKGETRVLDDEELLVTAGINLALAEHRITELQESNQALLQQLRWAAAMTDDEQAIVSSLAAKLMGEGRAEHGPMNLADDNRDLMGEACDELDDVMTYLMMHRRRMQLHLREERGPR